MTQDHGGVQVRSLDADHTTTLASDAYRYDLHALREGTQIAIDGYASAFAYVMSADTGVVVRAEGLEASLQPGDGVQLEGDALKVSCGAGCARILVVGEPGPAVSGGSSVVARGGDVHRVTKPWGHELWLTGRHPRYSLKQIFLTAGSRTSLQYHRQKRETNLLVEGTSLLYFRANGGVAIDDVTAADLGSVQMSPVAVIEVFPNTIHRLQAVTDITLYEASTAHLDDVVRVQDDAQRPDGTIDAEHRVS